eukprot:Gregarina_sp_Poly_1__52@NODE_100_length_14458_cov_232_622472_g87_i0_p3_GENE_NODE_100_length_14458_cov_232_622472_g87_i0NODE_100_length_14458_cov_232_622472_g87_i0_p3_ORF_typecomplete_len555_score76_32ERO1/PF04137_15/2_3e80ShK/PF01549_24/0_049_NODE_100_length_14458_cov_232_622472_g87_i024824146
MKSKKVIGGVGPLRQMYRVACHPFSLVVGAIVVLAVAFQALPGPEDQTGPASFTSLIAHAFAPVAKHFPTLSGFWSIESPRGKIVDQFPTAEEIEDEAHRILPLVEKLSEAKFFRIFKIDLSQECPFWARADLCSSPTGSCGVCECTEDQIPLPWKQKPVEHFVDRRLLEQEQVSPWVDPRNTGLELPGAAGEAEHSFLDLLSGQTSAKSSYVDLALNPPGFTAYRGRNIWGLIYKENCIGGNEAPDMQLKKTPQGTCTEEEMFEKMISGLQTTVMTLASEYNQPFSWSIPVPLTARSKTSGQNVAPRHWYDLSLFRWRVAGNRQWLENLYLDFSLLLRTLAHVSGVVEACPCYTGTEVEDSSTKGQLQELLRVVQMSPSGDPKRFAQPLFKRKQDLALRQFTNISRIFDCIECEKCRLHGKVKLTALQVAVKAGAGPSPVRSLERNEITALVNAIAYFGDAVLIVGKMRRRAQTLRYLTTGIILLPLGILCHKLGLISRLISKYIPATVEAAPGVGDHASSLGDLVEEIERQSNRKKPSARSNIRQRPTATVS